MSNKAKNQGSAAPYEPYRVVRKADLLSAGASGSFVGSEPVETEHYEQGRICHEPGCKTVLSIYNSADNCAQHPSNVVRLNRLNGGNGFANLPAQPVKESSSDL